MRVVYLELGVGGNTPGIIKYPFWRMTAQNPNAVYVCVNRDDPAAPAALGERALCLGMDAGRLLEELNREQ